MEYSRTKAKDAGDKNTSEESREVKVPFRRISCESGKCIDTADINEKNDGEAIPSLKSYLHGKVTPLVEALVSSKPKRERGQERIDEVASQFNTACVVLGDTNIKNRPTSDKKPQSEYKANYKMFYGQNHGYRLWKDAGIQEMSDALKNNLTTIGFTKWNPKNCAEVDAIQQATSAGVDLEHAHMYTVRADIKDGVLQSIDPMEACANCTASFGSSVRDRNYSGWSSNALEEDEDKFIRALKTAQEQAKTSWYATAVSNGWCENMDKEKEVLAKDQDRQKAEASRNAIRSVMQHHK